jgi:glucose 1-dehydrogenase
MCAREAISHFLAEEKPGSIVNVSSVHQLIPRPYYLSYSVSKGGMENLTRTLALEFAGRGIRVNGIAPALMLQSSGQSEENFKAMHANNPLGRGVEPEDVIGAIRYLAGARCVTGQVLVIDGGQRFLGLGRDVQFLETR